jgi:hypothetical protein
MALPSAAHLVSRLILVTSTAFFMASPVKRMSGLVGQGFNPDMGCQSSATARGFGSCHFSIVRREREIICKLK